MLDSFIAWFRDSFLAILISLLTALFGAGCQSPTNAVAERGMATRGATKVAVGLDAEGNLTQFAGETDGGSGSVVHVSRRSFFENGQLKSDFMGSSDPTLVQQTYFEGVRRQSDQDVTNRLRSLEGTVNQLARVAEYALPLVMQYAPPRPQQPPSSQPVPDESPEDRFFRFLQRAKEAGIIK